jgi:site-specific DNA recombinase
VWHEVCELLTNPQKLEKDDPGLNQADAPFENVETLKSQRVKLQHALERLIDSFTEGLIEKDQFTSRMDRTKRRIAELEAKIREDAGDVDRRENLRLVTNRLRAWPPLSAQSWQVPAGIADGRLSGHSSNELTWTPS